MIENSNTHWIFVCGLSSDSAPLRHLMDIDFGFKVLKKRGVVNSDISIVIDYKESIDEVLYSKEYSISFLSEIKTRQISDFENVVFEKQSKNIVIIVLGHGGHDGISSHTKLQPFQIVNAINKVKTVNSAFVLFGQCYGGVYNYLNLPCLTESKYNLCFCGAAKFTPSFSYHSTLESTKQAWVANYFILQFFIWLHNGCIDVDGDDKHTLLDAFKYMSLNTGDIHTTTQAVSFPIVANMQAEYNLLLVKSTSSVLTFEEKIKLATLSQDIKERAKFISTTPEPWILNMYNASEIRFCV